MEYHDFFILFEDYLYLNCIDISRVVGVKKNFFRYIFEICLVCFREQKESIIETFIEMHDHISQGACSDCLFSLRGQDIKDSDYFYVAISLVPCQ